jgi:hypothetical protein
MRASIKTRGWLLLGTYSPASAGTSWSVHHRMIQTRAELLDVQTTPPHILRSRHMMCSGMCESEAEISWHMYVVCSVQLRCGTVIVWVFQLSGVFAACQPCAPSARPQHSGTDTE